MIETRLKKAIENATIYLFPFTLPLFGTDFIIKKGIRNKEIVLINGMKILNFRTDFIIWKELGEWA
ncbi:MAG TPA: hypothetical protein GXX26_00205 [Clostridiaceae bacterium]|nr:hypothetical protein [Clostridiaceae bacterium]